MTINGREVRIPEGYTILRAADMLGIDIPAFCHDERLRFIQREKDLCCKLCSVEVEGEDSPVTACDSECKEGMIVRTESPAAVKVRKEILLRKLSKHPQDCLNCGKLGGCKLQRYCEKYGINEPLYSEPYEHRPIDDSGKFYYTEPDKCISCGKCERVCKHLMCVGAIKDGELAKEHACVNCGNCVSVCPVGALMPKSENKFRLWETSKVRTTCAYCGVGCRLDLIVKGDKVVDVQPADGKANEGLLCVKGKFAFDFINHKARLTDPLIRDEEGNLRKATWDEALDFAAGKIKAVREEFGPDAIAGFASARATNEENYLFMKFMRAAVGTNNVDHCARL